MSGSETKQDKIAKRYANALFEIAQEKRDLKIVLNDLNVLRSYLQEESLIWSQLVSPSVSLEVQHKIVEKLVSSLKLKALMHRFLLLLCQNRRLQKLNVILDVLLAQIQLLEGYLEVILETPTLLSKREIETFQKALDFQLGKKVTLRQEIKEKLLGGVVLRLGSFMIDASIRTQLNKLHYAMKG